MGYIITQADSEHLKQIKSLQIKNLKSSLDPIEVEREGFVTCDHTIELLAKMNQPDGHIIALHDNQVVGYCLVMSPRWREELDVLKPMFDKIDTLSYKGCPLSNYVVMGQVCIDKEHRRQGLFRQMYDHFRKCLSPKFDFCITEIATENTRSRSAHQAVGFEDVHDYRSFDGINWALVVWPWIEAVHKDSV